MNRIWNQIKKKVESRFCIPLEFWNQFKKEDKEKKRDRVGIRFTMATRADRERNGEKSFQISSSQFLYVYSLATYHEQ